MKINRKYVDEFRLLHVARDQEECMEILKKTPSDCASISCLLCVNEKSSRDRIHEYIEKTGNFRCGYSTKIQEVIGDHRCMDKEECDVCKAKILKYISTDFKSVFETLKERRNEYS